MAVIVESDQSLVETFHSALGDSSTVLDNLDKLDEHLDEAPDEYAVVLGPSVRAGAAARFANRARISRPSLGVVLVRYRVDSAILTDALRAGMREVVDARDLTGLNEAVGRAYNVWHAMSGAQKLTAAGGRPQGRLFTVFSTKGGVGKTVVAANLAVGLAGSGQRVCLVDLDVTGGDVGLLLQLFPTRSLADVEELGDDLDPSGVGSLLTRHSSGLDVLAAPIHYDPKQPLRSDLVNELLPLLKTMYDIVVVDTAGALDDDHALHALDHTDLLLLVGTLDIPALKSLKLAIETLDLLNVPRSSWRLVLNRADSKVGLTAKEFEHTLGLPITAAIPSSREVPASVNRGEPIVAAHPKHEVSLTIKALATEVAGVPADLAEEPRGHRSHVAERGETSSRGLFRRRGRKQ